MSEFSTIIPGPRLGGRLTGLRCRCGGCREFFNSVSVFDRHRVGPWTDGGRHRRCLTVDEMRAKGWLVNAAGFWIERARLDGTATSGDLDRPATLPRVGA